jgi:hypothetical protein
LGFLVEEADQALDVLGGRGQEELLTNELQSTQAHATQFREQCFYLLSLALCVREAGRVGQVSRALPGRFVHVDGKILQR